MYRCKQLVLASAPSSPAQGPPPHQRAGIAFLARQGVPCRRGQSQAPRLSSQPAPPPMAAQAALFWAVTPRGETGALVRLGGPGSIRIKDCSLCRTARPSPASSHRSGETGFLGHSPRSGRALREGALATAGAGCPELPITPLDRLRLQLLNCEGSAPGSWATVGPDRPE